MEEFRAASAHLHQAIQRYVSAARVLGMTPEWPSFLEPFRPPLHAPQHPQLPVRQDQPPPGALTDRFDHVSIPKTSGSLLERFDHVSIPKTSFSDRQLASTPPPNLPTHVAVRPGPKPVPRDSLVGTPNAVVKKKNLGNSKARTPAIPKKKRTANPKPLPSTVAQKSSSVHDTSVSAATSNVESSVQTHCQDCGSDYTSGKWRQTLLGEPLGGPTCSACYQKRHREKRNAEEHPPAELAPSPARPEGGSEHAEQLPVGEADRTPSSLGPSKRPALEADRTRTASVLSKRHRASGPSPPPSTSGGSAVASSSEPSLVPGSVWRMDSGS
ncbi:hypothetical protein A4X13_0g7747 [Tilletia indica]|uniref:Uncharacterized protein n=1 Tax=Tilletia indica TaxID=43049 RepID=A0A177TAT0_9BASI|nr:hypothetical protein A4X13_0g7747 [Tilletia indica]